MNKRLLITALCSVLIAGMTAVASDSLFLGGSRVAGIKSPRLPQRRSDRAHAGILFTVNAHFGDSDFLSLGSGGSYDTSGSATNDLMTVIKAMVVNPVNAGSMTVQFAQQASDGTATTVRANSYILAHRVS